MNAKIVDDIFYIASGDTLSYWIENNGNVIFNGKAVKSPDRSLSINVSKICRDWLENTLPDFRNFTDTSVSQYDAFQEFNLYTNSIVNDEVVPVLLETYSFLFGYDIEMPWTGQSAELSCPVNGHMDSRMKLFYSVYRATTGESICYEVRRKPVISYTPESFEFSPASGTSPLFVSSNVDYELSHTSDWIAISSYVGYSGTTSFVVSYLANTGLTDRTDTIEIKYKNFDDEYEYKHIGVSQISHPSVTYVNYIYTTQDDGMDNFINTGIIPSTADTLDVIWRCNYQGGYHISTCNEATGRTFYNWRVFIINNNLYYDYNYDSTRISKSSFAPATTEVLNWKIGNWYIKNNWNDTYIISGNTQSVIGDNLNYPYGFALGQGYLKEYKITRNGNVIFDGKAALDNNNVPCIFDTVSNTFKYYNGTQAYLAYTMEEPVNVQPSAATVSYESGTTSFNVTGYSDYNVTSNSAWISVSPSSGSTGVTQFNVQYDENEASSDRSGNISVGNNQFTLNQLAVQTGIPYNEIWYTSSDGNIVTPISSGTAIFGANIVSNTYSGGQGKIVFDGNVTSIGYRAFPNRSSLTEITIPDSVTSIGESAFYNCSSLTAVTIGNSVTSIGSGAFSNCSSLTEITIPDSVTSIGNSAFSSCRAMTTCTISSRVTSIGNYAFTSCYSLTEITIPDSVTSIGYYAFEDCTSMTTCTIGSGVTSIGNLAFDGCSSLSAATYTSTLYKFNRLLDKVGIGWRGNIGVIHCTNGDYSFNNFISTYSDGFKSEDSISNKSGLLACTITNKVTLISVEAFSRCYNLTGITIPNWIESIESEAFSYCSSMITCTIGLGVLYIGEKAFYNCDSLTGITIPNSVITISKNVFRDCNGMTTCTIGSRVTSIGESAFCDCSTLNTLNYNGTKAQWNTITKGDYWKYNVPATVVHCTDGDVSI